MKYIRTLTILSALLLLAACGSGTNPGTSPEAMQAGPKPNWLIQQPVDPNYYLGIGSASKNKYGSEAQKSSQDLALADLASQITVKITSDIVTSLIEKGAITKEEYLATARSEAVADLEGHELVDTWQDANYHYAYYRLSKAQYAAIQARKRQAALALSTDFLTKAKAADELSQFSESFNATIQAFVPLLPYLNEALEVEFNGGQVILSNEVNTQLQALLSGIDLSPNKSNLSAKLGQPISEKLTIYAKGNNNRALRGLPLKVEFKKGAGELLETIITGSQGSATLQVTSITAPLKLQILEISVDVEQLISGIDSPILIGIIRSIPLTSTRIILDVANPSIYLESNESFNGRTLRQLQVEPRIKNHFIGEGFHFVDNPKDADWQMTLSATATRGTEYSGMYTAFADVSLNVIDRKSGAEIYKNSLSRVKGIDLNYTNAANKAFNTAADKMIVTILPEILKSLK
ncbi:MAG: LPP20 family lipoprotein [Candidatus Marinimicrobia bacterium]|nr:LPP20 family lipoprotein [Candidatus Neomarinimicrobiota bacterium]